MLFFLSSLVKSIVKLWRIFLRRIIPIAILPLDPKLRLEASYLVNIPQASWRYGYFSINTEKWKYYFYEIHTASPVSKAFFEKRNQQLKQIKSDFFTHHQSQRERNAKIIMLGDFNTSPRSAYYADFAESFSGTLENITKTFPILFTRNLWEMLNVHKDFSFLPLWIRKAWGYFPFFQSHIDHVFLSPNLKFKNLKKIQIPGSDHSGFIFEIE